MTGPNGIYANPRELIAVLQQLVDDYPDCKVEKNAVGNLSIIAIEQPTEEYIGVFPPTAEWIGWIDLAFPALHYYSEADEED